MSVDAGSVYSEFRLKLSNLEKDINDANARLKKLNDDQKKKASRFAKLWQSGFAAIGLSAAATVAAVAAISKQLINTASDAEEVSNKFGVVFNGLEDAAAVAETLADSYGLSSTASKDLLSSTADLLQGFGVAKSESLDLSRQVQELAVDLASFTNYAGGAEGASEALTKALLGERESVKQLGIAITETELKKFAEEQGLVYKELDRAAKASLTLELAYKQSANAIGDFERSQDSFANQLRISKSNMEDLSATFGQDLIPAATEGLKIFNQLTEAINESKKALDEYKDAQSAISEGTATAEQRIRVLESQIKAADETINRFGASQDANLKRAVETAEANKRQFEAEIRNLQSQIAHQEYLNALKAEGEAEAEALALAEQEAARAAAERQRIADEAYSNIVNGLSEIARKEQTATLTGEDYNAVAERRKLVLGEIETLNEEGFSAQSGAIQYIIEKYGELIEIEEEESERRIDADTQAAYLRQSYLDEYAASYTEWKEEEARLDDEANERRIGYLLALSSVGQTAFSSLSNVVGAYYDYELSLAEGNEEKQAQLRKEQFEVTKYFSAVETGIAGAQAAIEAYKALSGIPYVGPALGAAAALAIGALTATEVGFILAQQAPSFAYGGIALPTGGGTNAIVAENGSAELMLNAGTQGEAFLNEFAQRVAAAGVTQQRIEVPLIVDGVQMARAVVDVVNNRGATVNESSVVNR